MHTYAYAKHSREIVAFRNTRSVIEKLGFDIIKAKASLSRKRNLGIIPTFRVDSAGKVWRLD